MEAEQEVLANPKSLCGNRQAANNGTCLGSWVGSPPGSLLPSPGWSGGAHRPAPGCRSCSHTEHALSASSFAKVQCLRSSRQVARPGWLWCGRQAAAMALCSSTQPGTEERQRRRQWLVCQPRYGLPLGHGAMEWQARPHRHCQKPASSSSAVESGSSWLACRRLEERVMRLEVEALALPLAAAAAATSAAAAASAAALVLGPSSSMGAARGRKMLWLTLFTTLKFLSQWSQRRSVRRCKHFARTGGGTAGKC